MAEIGVPLSDPEHPPPLVLRGLRSARHKVGEQAHSGAMIRTVETELSVVCFLWPLNYFNIYFDRSKKVSLPITANCTFAFLNRISVFLSFLNARDHAI
mgnify:FL=1